MKENDVLSMLHLVLSEDVEFFGYLLFMKKNKYLLKK